MWEHAYEKYKTIKWTVEIFRHLKKTPAVFWALWV
jgi:hypothetical protein